MVLTAAIDLKAHGGLDVDEAFVEEAATRIGKIRAETGVTRGEPEYRRCGREVMWHGKARYRAAGSPRGGGAKNCGRPV